jgi:hypothetical protein
LSEPGVRISRIGLPDWFHREEAHGKIFAWSLLATVVAKHAQQLHGHDGHFFVDHKLPAPN